jgi:tripeptidyl-peptidase II
MSKDSNSGNVWGGLLPKTETQSAQFCEKNPECDGRGVVVGIMDTGVCPAAIGLQKTPDGRPKVIDIIDCTGSGDVLMSDWIKPSDEGFLTHDYVGSLKIKINPAWVNPTGQYRVGCKVWAHMLYHLCCILQFITVQHNCNCTIVRH